LFISEGKCCWSMNSVIQFEQNFDKGLFDDDAITIGISLRHDEHTPPVLPLFILLVSFMISSIFFLGSLYRGHTSKPATIEIKSNESCWKPAFFLSLPLLSSSQPRMEPDNNLK
jgi:hypothetical protein